jgi:biotin carboxyl carrier protein
MAVNTQTNVSINPKGLQGVTAHPAPSQPAQNVTTTFRPTKGISAKQIIKWPTAYKRINQGAHPGHEAWDIQAPQGSPIYSPISGTVVKVVPMDPYGWGNAIQIVSSDGKFHMFFGHLQSFLVGEGQQVVAGQEIGLADSTYTPPGFSSGSHLHFEVRDAAGKPIDPQIFFNDESLTVPVDPNGPTITLGKVQQSMGANAEQAQNAGAAATAPATIPTASPSKSSLGSFVAGALSVAGGTVATPQAQQSSSSSDAGGTVLAHFDLLSTPAGKIGINITAGSLAMLIGAIMLIIGMIQIGWKPAVKIAGVAAKAAVA